jgi:predicted metal-binding protein
MITSPTTPRTELLVCTTCRPTDAPRDGAPGGQALFDQIEAALAFDPPAEGDAPT